MSKVVGRSPRSLIHVVTDPVDKIVQLPVPEPRIKDRLNLELGNTIHVERKSRSDDAAWKLVWNMGLQEADVENRMDVHRRWKIQMESRRTNLANDGERAKSADIQFGRRTVGRDVTS